jgi:hypothetical protein
LGHENSYIFFKGKELKVSQTVEHFHSLSTLEWWKIWVVLICKNISLEVGWRAGFVGIMTVVNDV